MRKLWSHIREQTQGDQKRQGEDSSYPKAVEGLLRATARKNYPKSENVDIRMIAPEAHDVRRSGRVLELQNRDLWIRPTDLSWNHPLLWPFVRRPSGISVEGHLRNWMPETTRSRRTRSRRLWKYNQMAAVILDLEYFILIFCLARMEIRRDTRAYWLAVSCLGQLRPSAWAWGMAIVRLMAVTLLMAMRSFSWILTRALMTTKMTSVCDGVHLFAISATCLVSCERRVRLT